jgi:hypothetical protein
MSKSSNVEWITVHPNGKEHKGQPIPVEEGKTKGEAVKDFIDKHSKKSVDELKKEVSTELPKEENTVVEAGFKPDTSKPAINPANGRTDPIHEQKIVKETDKAIAVPNPLYSDAKDTAKYDVKELSSKQIDALKSGPYVWLPKSQVTIENGTVTELPQWLASKSGIFTRVDYDNQLAKNKAYQDATDKYNKLVEFAKENGVKGAKVGLKTDTLLKMIKQAGLNYEY